MKNIKPLVGAFGLVTLLQGGSAYATLLDFEDVYGTVNALDSIPGPSTTTIGIVTFSTPDITFNRGKDTGASSWSSDYFTFFTFGSGATLKFADPVTSIAFDFGQSTPVVTAGTFDLAIGANVFATITDSVALQSFAFSFSNPITQLSITFVSGSTSALSIDNLSLGIPGPSSFSLFTLGIVLLKRKIMESAG